jgi:uncharacterized protein (DUF58 family)
MLNDELRKKVKRIEFSTKKLVQEAMSGQYKTHFRGQGMQFSEHRSYAAGDDVRHMDWKASARNREPLIKKFEEERDLSVLLLVDVSKSGIFGSKDRLKTEVVAELAGMITYAATHTGDKVGALLFSDRIEKTVPIKKGRNHVLNLVTQILTHQTKGDGTDLNLALQTATRLLKHTGLIFLVSDLLTTGYEQSLKKAAKKHDVIAIDVEDERDYRVPDVGLVLLKDPESGREVYVQTGSYRFQEWLKKKKIQHEAEVKEICNRCQVERLKIMSQEDYGEALIRFFNKRQKRYA